MGAVKVSIGRALKSRSGRSTSSEGAALGDPGLEDSAVFAGLVLVAGVCAGPDLEASVVLAGVEAGLVLAGAGVDDAGLVLAGAGVDDAGLTASVGFVELGVGLVLAGAV